MNGLVDDVHRIVVNQIPLLDVRSPGEYNAGAYPQATNLPLLDDHQRHLVGLCYRQKGKDEAINLGHQLVSDVIKESRLAAWQSFIHNHPQAVLCCYRGGLRSQISQQWIEESTGLFLPRLAGGYKKLRKYLLDQLDPTKLNCTPILLGGRTGSGKTILLGHLENGVDLESIANHRGSSFGRQLSPQPGQADFENRLATALINHRHQGYRYLVVEDEGKHIGKRYIPRSLANHLGKGDLVLLEAPLEQRILTIFDEYVIRAQDDYICANGNKKGLELWIDDIMQSLQRIGKRLGSQRLIHVSKLMRVAHQEQLRTNSAELHISWIKVLITEYYDPMYDYQLKKKNREPVLCGSKSEVLPYLQSMETCPN